MAELAPCMQMLTQALTAAFSMGAPQGQPAITFFPRPPKRKSSSETAVALPLAVPPAGEPTMMRMDAAAEEDEEEGEDASDEAIATEAAGVETAAKGMTVAESTAKIWGVLGAKKGGVMKKPAAVGKAAAGGKAKLPDGVVARFKEEADKVRVH